MRIINEFLNTVTLKDLVYSIVGVITAISIVVEKTKKLPFKPWTHFLEWIGKCITKDMNTRLNNIEQQQKANNDAINELNKKVERKFQEKQKDDDEKEAKRLRANIMCFADSCRVGNKHTQAHFENVMRDYSDYMNYCDRHDLLNHFIDSEYQYISEIYRECLRENDFL